MFAYVHTHISPAVIYSSSEAELNSTDWTNDIAPGSTN